MIIDLTLLAGTQIQLSGVLEERFKARDLRCPQAARAVPLVCQNDKVESSRSAEKILGSGDHFVRTAVLEPAIITLWIGCGQNSAKPLWCVNGKKLIVLPLDRIYSIWVKCFLASY